MFTRISSTARFGPAGTSRTAPAVRRFIHGQQARQKQQSSRPTRRFHFPRQIGPCRARIGRGAAARVLMFRILILQASHSLSDERTEYLIKDRPSFMRFLGLSLADRVPGANSIWTFREALTRATIGGVPAIVALFRRFEAQL
jgi:hypothetical protein